MNSFLYFIYSDEFNILILSWEDFWSVVYNENFWVGTGISALMSITDGLGSYILRRKIEKTRLRREEMDGKVFIPHQSRQFLLHS